MTTTEAGRFARALDRLRRAAGQRVDGASYTAFRVLFGLLLTIAPLRMLATGWVAIQYVEPTFMFRYYGFAWVPVPDPRWVHAEFALLAVLGAAVALGAGGRAAPAAYALLFAHLKLADVTNYLNHDYLVWLLSVLLVVLPAPTAVAPGASRTVPAYTLWLLRFQVGVVYAFAAVAKFTPDWLLYAQPVGVWLRARSEWPVLGPLFELPATAWVFAWGGFLFDATIVGWLSWRPARAPAYLVLLAFHAVTWGLFDIGMFPFIMPAATTLFFDPSWPRGLLARFAPRLRGTVAAPAGTPDAPPSRAATAAALVWAAFHVLVPLRAFVYPGNVLWAEEGMRWSWRVMAREKAGGVTFVVVNAAGARRLVEPESFLMPRQMREMAVQPDLIVQAAQHVAAEAQRAGRGPVRVYAETAVSLNGRRPAPLIDPAVDLAAVQDGVLAAPYVLPAPAGPPAPPGLNHTAHPGQNR